MNRIRESGFIQGVIYLVVVAVILMGGYYLAIALIPTPKIGIIELKSPVGSSTALRMSREIDFVLNSRDIKGVVLEINSPGGIASAGYDIYFQVRRLREAKPVVVSIDSLAASAAYQISVAGNEIYAKPASFIGNVGAIFRSPGRQTLSETIITTGPFKSTGASATDVVQKLELLHADFRDSVIAERTAAPNPITLTSDELATGEIWMGIEAKQFGLIDELGSRLDAIEAVARLANLKNYEVVDVRDEFLASLAQDQLQTALTLYEAEAQAEFDLAAQELDWPTFYQIYIPLE
ncbi:MAG: S49 family peptidase [Anaerolineae bacterium]